MRRVVMGLAAAVAIAVPATATAAEIPPINCGIVSCTYQLDKAEKCVQNGVGAIRNTLQGTPQPGECDL